MKRIFSFYDTLSSYFRCVSDIIKIPECEYRIIFQNDICTVNTHLDIKIFLRHIFAFVGHLPKCALRTGHMSHVNDFVSSDCLREDLAKQVKSSHEELSKQSFLLMVDEEVIDKPKYDNVLSPSVSLYKQDNTKTIKRVPLINECGYVYYVVTSQTIKLFKSYVARLYCVMHDLKVFISDKEYTISTTMFAMSQVFRTVRVYLTSGVNDDEKENRIDCNRNQIIVKEEEIKKVVENANRDITNMYLTLSYFSYMYIYQTLDDNLQAVNDVETPQSMMMRIGCVAKDQSDMQILTNMRDGYLRFINRSSSYNQKSSIFASLTLNKSFELFTHFKTYISDGSKFTVHQFYPYIDEGVRRLYLIMFILYTYQEEMGHNCDFINCFYNQIKIADELRNINSQNVVAPQSSYASLNWQEHKPAQPREYSLSVMFSGKYATVLSYILKMNPYFLMELFVVKLFLKY